MTTITNGTPNQLTDAEGRTLQGLADWHGSLTVTNDYPGPRHLFGAHNNQDNARRYTFTRLVARGLIARRRHVTDASYGPLYRVTPEAVALWQDWQERTGRCE